MTSPSIKVFFPGPMANVQVSRSCISLCEPISRELPLSIFASALIKGYRSPLVTPAAPPLWTHVGYRYSKRFLRLSDRLERRFLSATGSGDIAWLWPGRVVPVARRLKERGVPIFAEVINTHQAYARRVLEAELRRLGLPSRIGITDERIADEIEFYELADKIFSPSPLVSASLLDNGVDPRKIIETSYGFDAIDGEEPAIRTSRADGGVKVLSVGTVCIRKGQHLLAAAWNAAGIQGELSLIGWIGDDFRGKAASMLAGKGIEVSGPTTASGVRKAMRGADIFAFASLEEGDPLVTYEAASQGLAILTTPAGAGRLVRDGVEGIVLDPHDRDAWVQSLRSLAGDPGLRARLGAAARDRASSFGWSKVAKAREGWFIAFNERGA